MPEIQGRLKVAQTVKHLPTMRETRVLSLGQEDPLEKEMVAHSSTLAWKISWMEEPGRLQAMGSQRVGHDWATSLPFPVFLLSKSHGQRSLVGYYPWGCKRVRHDWKTKQQQNSNRIPDFTCWLDLALVWQHGILSKLFGMYITFHIYQFFCYHSIVWRKNGYFDIPWYMELC